MTDPADGPAATSLFRNRDPESVPCVPNAANRIRSGELDKAIELLRAMRSPEGHLALGIILEVSGQLRDADGEYEAAQGDAKVGAVLDGSRRNPLAIAAAEARKTCGRAGVSIGQAFAARNEWDAAAIAFSRAVGFGDPAAPEHLVFALIMAGREPEAEKELQSASGRTTAGEVRHRIGLALQKAGNPRAARLQFLQAYDEGVAGAAVDIGALSESAGDTDGAMTWWKRAEDSGDPEAPWRRALVHRRSGDRDKALAAALEADMRGSAEGAYWSGVMLDEAGEHIRAVEAWRRGDIRGNAKASERLGMELRATDPGHAMAKLLRAAGRGSVAAALSAAQLAGEMGDTALETEMRAFAERIPEIVPECRGEFFRPAEYRDPAIGAWRRAEKQGSAHAALALGATYYEIGGAELAESRLTRAIGRGLSDGYVIRGLLRRDRGDWPSAIADFRAADALGNSDGAYHLGGALLRDGNADEALAAYTRADERGHAEAAFCVARMLSERRAQGRADDSDADQMMDALERADRRGSGRASLLAGMTASTAGEDAEAEAAYLRAAERGIPEGSANLAVFYERRGETEAARNAQARAELRYAQLTATREHLARFEW